MANALEGYNQKLDLIRDRTAFVVERRANGMYLYGPGGTSKTYGVRKQLNDMLGKDGYYYAKGYMTPAALMDVLEENEDGVIVLDDVLQLLADKKAVQLLLAALGHEPNHTDPRLVEYRTAKDAPRRVQFKGGVILISNVNVARSKDPSLLALMSRTQVLHFEPKEDEMRALILHLATQGQAGLSPEECLMIAKRVIEIAKEKKGSLNLRVFLEKGLGDYKAWKEGSASCHWEDLLASNIAQEAKPDTEQFGKRKRTKEQEYTLIRSLMSEFDTQDAQIGEWQVRTGKSERAFFRRLAEMKDGEIEQDDDDEENEPPTVRMAK